MFVNTFVCYVVQKAKVDKNIGTDYFSGKLATNKPPGFQHKTIIKQMEADVMAPSESKKNIAKAIPRGKGLFGSTNLSYYKVGDIVTL